MTPSTSIDQISLNGSICSLDTGSHIIDGETPHNDHVISKVDRAIVEAGPVNGSGSNVRDDSGYNGKVNSSRKVQTSIIRSKSSQGAVYGNGLQTSSRSVDNTPSHSPLRVQRSLSPHHYRHSTGQHVHMVDKDQYNGSSPNRSSLPTPQQVYSTPQFHRKDVHSLPAAIGGGDYHRHPPPKIPPALLPPSRLPNWPITPVIHGGPNMIPHSAPIICGRVPPSGATILPPNVYPQTAAINGLLQQATPSPNLGHIGYHHQRVPSYPITAPHSSVGTVNHSNTNPVSCYNCGLSGHLGSLCPNNNEGKPHLLS